MKSIAKFIGVDEGRQFKFSKGPRPILYRVNENAIEVYDEEKGWKLCGLDVNSFINMLEFIILIPEYSLTTIENARYDIHRFNFVARNKHNKVKLFTSKPVYYKESDFYWCGDDCSLELSSDNYPEIKPGQCIELSEIIKGIDK